MRLRVSKSGLGRKGLESMLSKTAEYALRAAVCLAQSTDVTLSAEVLASQTKVPRRYLHKVVQGLVAAKLVRSQPGPGGGYALKLPASQVTILDVVNAVAPMERITHCPLGLTSHTALCPLHKQLDDTYAATQKALAAVTLEAVLRSSNKVVPLCEVKVDGQASEAIELKPPSPAANGSKRKTTKGSASAGKSQKAT